MNSSKEEASSPKKASLPHDSSPTSGTNGDNANDRQSPPEPVSEEHTDALRAEEMSFPIKDYPGWRDEDSHRDTRRVVVRNIYNILEFGKSENNNISGEQMAKVSHVLEQRLYNMPDFRHLFEIES